jgi:hypothetical protein
MATTSTSFAQAPFAQFEELSEQLLEGARKAGTQYLEAYEKAVGRAVALERKLAASSGHEWLAQLLETHAELSQDLTKAYTSAARTLFSS